jgi:hypothetical protein
VESWFSVSRWPRLRRTRAWEALEQALPAAAPQLPLEPAPGLGAPLAERALAEQAPEQVAELEVAGEREQAVGAQRLIARIAKPS